ncbi:MAG: hypothetical protein ACLRMD_05455 [Ruminococcus sp.]
MGGISPVIVEMADRILPQLDAKLRLSTRDSLNTTDAASGWQPGQAGPVWIPGAM